MRFVDIEVGQEYGERLTVSVGQPLLHVLVLHRVDRTKQLRVRHLDEPHEGMEEYLSYSKLQTP